MFGLFKSKKQRLFDRYGEVIHDATMAGIAFGYLINSGEEKWAKKLLETYVVYESLTSDLMSPGNRDHARKLMKELFDAATQDESLLSDMDELKIAEIEGKLVKNIDSAKDVLARNRWRIDAQ